MHITTARPKPETQTASREDSFDLSLNALRARRKKRALMWAGAGVVALLAMGFTAYTMSAPPKVATITVKSQATERVLAVTGRVKPRESVQVFAKTAGQVVSLTKDEGDMVTAGEVLGQIDPARAKTSVTQAQAAVDAQSRTLAQFERDLERARALLANGTVTVASVETATLAVTKGREDLRRLAAVRDEAQLSLRDLVVVAPFDGRILNRPVDPGQMVDTKTSLFAIAPVTAQEIETEVDETYSMALREGQEARLAFAGVPQTITGRVAYLAPEIQTSTGGRIVRIEFDTPAGLDLPVGLSVDVNIVVARDDNAVTVPRAAIRDIATAPYVLTVKNGVVEKQAISFIDWPAASVVVKSGLSAGDAVIMGPKAPAPGSKVEA